MQRATNQSAAKKGMNKDAHASQLQNFEYISAINANTENESGEGLNVGYEPSNYLCTVFPEGYKVIGFANNQQTNQTFFLLTNPTTRRSSVGYIENTQITKENIDEYNACNDCEGYNELGVPLETVAQTPFQPYVELFNDNCIEGEGLNFDINFPVKNIALKNEKGTVTGYWDDYRNPSRYCIFSDVEYLFTEQNQNPCEDPVTTTCLKVDRLLHFPKHSHIRISPDVVQTGGNLKMGSYEYWAVYCDEAGNSVVNYSTPTQPVKIFDENNNILEQTELDSFTNFAIKLKIENLDDSFSFYKVVCVERTSVDGALSSYIVGIYPTSDNTVLHTSSGSNNDDTLTNGNVRIQRRIDNAELYRTRPIYEKAKVTDAVSNMLWKTGLKERETLNLQPVVNLFSSLLRWQSTVVKEDLYKSAIATSKYVGYQRDEVKTFGIRFKDSWGNVTPIFPFIGRPSLEGELDIIDDENYQSISDVPSCVQVDRNKRWQIFNTAQTLDFVNSETWECDANLGESEYTEDVVKVCRIRNVNVLPDDTITITDVGNFTNLSDYVEDNPDVIIPGLTEFLQEEYPESTCTPNFNNCSNITLQSSYNKIGEVLNETYVFIEKDEDDYQKSLPPSYCAPYKINNENNIVEDQTMRSFMPCSGSNRRVVYERDFNGVQNEDCTYAEAVVNSTEPVNGATAYFHKPYGADILTDLLQTKNALATDTNFNNKLHKGALWFKIDKNGRDKIALEITKTTTCSDRDDLQQLNKLRFNVYESCTSTDSVQGQIFTTGTGVLKYIDATLLPDTFYVAVDAPIYAEAVPVTCSNPLITTIVYKTSPSCGCFSILTRDIEFISVDVSWSNLIIDKYQRYEAECNFFIPRVDSCIPQPYQNGEFSYWESREEYPTNADLYDSSSLVIAETDLANLSEVDRNRFENFYVDDVTNGNYVLKNADFRCQKIRHFKMPDNRVSPYVIEFTSSPFSETIIAPLGIMLDDEIVRTMLNVAVKNNLITQQQANTITEWEIVTGDSTLNKSIVANGLGFDFYNYQRDNKTVHYANFPFNDLGEDVLHYQDGNRRQFIQHPYDGEVNNKLSIISPDLILNKPTLPTEISITGFLTGNSKTQFTEVKDHPKWTILGDRARRTADTLAFAEAALELVVKSAELTSNQWFVGGVVFGGSFGLVGSALASAAYLIQQFMKVGQYRYQWLRIFRDLGTKYNFANYAVAEGYYNRFLVNPLDESYLRALTLKKYLKEGDWQFIDEYTGERVFVNNFRRERSTFISTGNYPVIYDLSYAEIDNRDIDLSSSSRFIASEENCELNSVSIRNVASPYITLKNYIPDQWGTIDSIKWLTTNYSFNLNENTRCTTIFGGTTYISRFTYKRKLPLFRATAMGQADRTPVEYYNYKNIGFPNYFCDYETGTEKRILGIPFPDISSNHNFDCQNGRTSFYVKPNSKFYLYYYGIVDFLVESEINCNFRYGKTQLKDQFYPQVGDVVEWTQERNLSIREPNTFYYNPIYSYPVSNSPYSVFDRTYTKERWALKALQENAVIYSEQDNSQNQNFDPWRVYKPLNWYEFDKKYGKLLRVVDAGNSQVFALFEDGLRIFNAIDNLADRILPQTKELGTGGIFTTRPIDFEGAGSQSTEVITTPFGSFFTDAKRGKVHVYSGRNIETISEIVGGQPSNMKNWFRENLPFKLLRDIPNAYTDNKFNGLGLNMWFDHRFDRLFITKRDYVVKDGVNKQLLSFDEEQRKFYFEDEEIFLDDTTYFEDVSWTIAFKVGEGWISFYTFYPNYTVGGIDYFQVGYNDLENLWSHTFSNSSFLVFQGQRNRFEIDLPIINQNTTKNLESLSVHLETKRHQNTWDYSLHPEKGYNKALIYNPNMNSHNLELIFQDTIQKTAQYPITEPDKQKILYNARNGHHSFNYFFNRLKSQNLNIPHLLWDKNRIFKEVNPQAVSFKGKSVLEQLRGEYFTVSLINDSESRFNTILRRVASEESYG